MAGGIYSGLKCPDNVKKDFKPLPHQIASRDFFCRPTSPNGPYKGLLLFHELGSGKTCTAFMVADDMLEKKLVSHVYILTPGSLRQGWLEEYCNVCGVDDTSLQTNYTFITYNYSVYKRLPNFNGSLVIIDEVHNLLNGVKNFSINPLTIYNKLFNSNCRILALSGTPVINSVGEWPILGKLLKPDGDIFPKIISMSDKSINRDIFLNNFRIQEDGSLVPINKTYMKRKFSGIISYYPGAAKEFMPEVEYMPIIKVKMSAHQEKNYWIKSAQEEEMSFPPSKRLMAIDRNLYNILERLYIMCKKHILTRSASNFYYPELYKIYKDIPGQIELSKDERNRMIDFLKKDSLAFDLLIDQEEDDKEVDESKIVGNIEKIVLRKKKKSLSKDEADKILENREVTEEDKKQDIETKEMNEIIKVTKNKKGWVNGQELENKKLLSLSPKITALILNILNYPNQKHVVFTFFKTKAGAYIIRSLFNLCGIKCEIFSGDLSDEERKHLLRRFNAEKNREGKRIKVLIVTEAGSEGISVMETRHMHILESSPKFHKIKQAIGRIARYKSHYKMDKKDQNVKVWRYWSVPSGKIYNITVQVYGDDGQLKNKEFTSSSKSIDEILYDKELKSTRQVESFINILKMESIVTNDIGSVNKNVNKNVNQDGLTMKKALYSEMRNKIILFLRDDMKYSKENLSEFLKENDSNIKKAAVDMYNKLPKKDLMNPEKDWYWQFIYEYVDLPSED